MFMPGGIQRLCLILAIIVFVALLSHLIKYDVVAGLFGVTVPGWNS